MLREVGQADSLSGLVTKKVVCLSAESVDSEYDQPDGFNVAIYFLATPHGVSSLVGHAARF